MPSREREQQVVCDRIFKHHLDLPKDCWQPVMDSQGSEGHSLKTAISGWRKYVIAWSFHRCFDTE